MSNLPNNVDDLINYLRAQLRAGNFNFREIRTHLFALMDQQKDDRLFTIEDDMTNVKKHQDAGGDLTDILPNLWLFSDQVVSRSISDFTHDSDDIPTSGYDSQPQEELIWSSKWGTDEAEENTTPVEPGYSVNAALPPAEGTSHYDNQTVFSPSNRADDLASSDTVLEPLAGNANNKLLDEVQFSLEETPPNYIKAVDGIEAIKEPSSTLTPEQLARFRALRDRTDHERREEQNRRRANAKQKLEDDHFPLDEVVAAFDMLLDHHVTRDTEERDAVEMRNLLSAAQWSPTKSERYIRYFESRDKGGFPTLNERYEWLRAQRVQLEGIQAATPRSDATSQAEQILKRINPEIDQIGLALAKTSSRNLDRDYVGSTLLYEVMDQDSLVIDPNDPLEESIPVRRLIQRLAEEYATFTYTQARYQFLDAAGTDGKKVLDAAVRGQPFAEFLHLSAQMIFSDLEKAIRLGLINLAPSKYLGLWPDLTVEGNRSRDPDPTQMDDINARREFIILRDTLLPALLGLLDKTRALLSSEKLEDVYALMDIWTHSEVLEKANRLEEKLMQAVTRQLTNHQQLYQSGDFWDFYAEDADFQSYIDGEVNQLTRLPFVKLSLAQNHPHRPALDSLKQQIDQLVQDYQGLVEVRATLVRDIDRIDRQLENVQKRLNNHDNPGEIEGTLNRLREWSVRLREQYYYRPENLISQINRISRENDAQRTTKSLVEEAENLFDAARRGEREGNANAAAELWHAVIAKTERFERPVEDDANAPRGHLLYLFAQAKYFYYYAQTLSAVQANERTRMINRADGFFRQLNERYDHNPIEARQVVPSPYVKELGDAISIQLERAQVAEANQDKIRKYQSDLETTLANAAYQLLVFVNFAEDITQEIAQLPEEDKFRDALEGYYKEQFASRFDQELDSRIDAFLRRPDATFEDGNVIYTAFEWLTSHDLHLPASEGRKLNFTQRYRGIAEATYEQQHSQYDRDVIDPFDLPFPPSAYEYWFQLRLYATSNAFANTVEERKSAIVAAYYLLSRAQNDDNSFDLNRIIHYLEVVFQPEADVFMNVNERKAIEKVRRRDTVYVLRDAIIFVYASKLLRDIQINRILNESELQDDPFAHAAREQVQLLKTSVSSSASMLGEMWVSRLDALEQFARGDYNRTRRTIRDFNRSTLFVPPTANDSDWAQRRYAETYDAMSKLRKMLFGRVEEGIEFGRPARDARELKERLSVAVFFLESNDARRMKRGKEILDDLRKGGNLKAIHDQIENEFRGAMTTTLPNSVNRAEELVEALRDDLELTNDELQNADLDQSIRDQFKALFERLEQTHEHLMLAKAAMVDGIQALQNVVLNQNGVNRQDDWNEAIISDRLAEAEISVDNAINQSSFIYIAGLKGTEDFQPFKSTAEAVVKDIRIIRQNRANIQGKLRLNQPPPDPKLYFAELEKEVQLVVTAQASIKDTLKATYPQVEFKIPVLFFTSNSTIAFQSLHEQVLLSIKNSGLFLDWIRLFSDESNPEVLATWAKDWAKDKVAFTRIQGLADHVLIIRLLVERIERWNTFFIGFMEAYQKYHSEWLDVALWHAYYNEILTKLCELTHTPDSAPLPDRSELQKVVEPLSTLKPVCQPNGQRNQIPRELEEYNREAASFQQEISQFGQLGEIPFELRNMYRNFTGDLQDKEREVRMIRPTSPNAIKVGERTVEAISLINELLDDHRSMETNIRPLKQRVDLRSQYVGTSEASRGLLHVYQYIENEYLPVLVDEITLIQREISKERNRGARARLEKELVTTQRVYDLFEHSGEDE